MAASYTFGRVSPSEAGSRFNILGSSDSRPRSKHNLVGDLQQSTAPSQFLCDFIAECSRLIDKVRLMQMGYSISDAGHFDIESGPDQTFESLRTLDWMLFD